MKVLIAGHQRISRSALIAAMNDAQIASNHVIESRCGDFENNREIRYELGMPALPERQTYVPPVNRKSKRW